LWFGKFERQLIIFLLNANIHIVSTAQYYREKKKPRTVKTKTNSKQEIKKDQNVDTTASTYLTFLNIDTIASKTLSKIRDEKKTKKKKVYTNQTRIHLV